MEINDHIQVNIVSAGTVMGLNRVPGLNRVQSNLLSRTGLFRITAYLEVKIWSLF